MNDTRDLNFVNPRSGGQLKRRGDSLWDASSEEIIARVVDGIPRFVEPDEDYADSFGFQWNKWHSVLSQSRSNYQHAEDLKKRSGLWDGVFDVKGKRLLECGMGGGDDTEVLLTLPFSEIHSFDISRSVERAAKYLKDPRLTISQASIYEIPYPKESFDVVWCHRVIQHTPDPEAAMRCVCRMVKPGGFLFIHSYKRSKRYMQEFRYFYRPLTTRLPKYWIYLFLRFFGAPMHYCNRVLGRVWPTRELAYRFLPFYLQTNELMKRMGTSELIEWQRMVTFDALTPRYDSPMTSEEFRRILRDEGFEILWIHDPDVNPLIARAVRK